jgi:hypothetical protein
VDLDGDVDASDKSELQTNYQGITLGRGVLSSSATASRKGYAGYEGLTNLAGSQWLARNRVLMAELGRWGSRDYYEYIDGLNLAAYAKAMPIIYIDALGMAAIYCRLEQPVVVVLEQVSQPQFPTQYLDIPPQKGLKSEWAPIGCMGCIGKLEIAGTVSPDTPASKAFWHPPGYPKWYVDGDHFPTADENSEPRGILFKQFAMPCNVCIAIKVEMKGRWPRSPLPNPSGAPSSAPPTVSAEIQLCCTGCKARRQTGNGHVVGDPSATQD